MAETIATPIPFPGEQALLLRARSGDEAAFALLVGDQVGRLRAVARRILGDEELADDAVQDAMVSAIRALPRFDGRAKLSTWLHRIVVNASLMLLRRRSRRMERSTVLCPALPEAPSNEPAGLARAVRDELCTTVRARIDDLPAIARSVILLRDIEGHSTTEAAEILGVSPATVKTRLHRARHALRRHLETTNTIALLDRAEVRDLLQPAARRCA